MTQDMCDLYELDGVDIEDFCIKEDKIVVS
jgi:hypothetical protein